MAVDTTAMDRARRMNETERRDFFISYTGSDQAWAEWIAWHIEEAGYSTVIQAWDFRPGYNFVLEMDRASRMAEHTVIVLSQAFLTAFYTQPEWAAAFARDPKGHAQKLIPVRVEAVKPEGLLSPIIYIDLVGKKEEVAKVALLRGIAGERTKPAEPPIFPGQSEAKRISRPLTFPGKQVSVPAQLSPYVDNFLRDHEDARRTALLIMQFSRSRAHLVIRESITKVLKEHNITMVQVYDKAYAPDLARNSETYLHGCTFAIVVLERTHGYEMSPNVALEFGYLLALGKPVCLLKEATLAPLQTDLVESLYSEFDPYDPEPGVRIALSRWLKDRSLTESEDGGSQQSAAGDADKPRA